MSSSHNARSYRPTEAKMPTPEVYEQEYVFWPWGRLLVEATKIAVGHAPRASFVLDYMSGTGFLLNKILSKRPDISALGCDISRSYVDYARRTYPTAKFVRGDALTHNPSKRPDLIICTAGLHHLKRGDQPKFIKKVSAELKPAGLFLLGEELVRNYRNERERKKAVLDLFSELMLFLAKRKTPNAVVQAAADMLVNEWCERGEYKASHREIERMLHPFFKIILARRIWPDEGHEFGDWIFLCQKR